MVIQGYSKMRFSQKLLIIISSFFIFVQATWYSSEHMICDSSGTSWIPFTGFKIHRQFVVKSLRPPMLHFVSLSHCDHGQLNYERLTRTGRETDIEWDKPFCILSSSKLSEKFHDSDSLAIPFEKAETTFSLNFDDVPKKPHSIDLSHLKPATIHKFVKRSSIGFRHTFNDFLRKISSRLRFIEYIGNSLLTNLEDLNPISYQNITIDDLDDLKCYKLARRKKYAQRKMVIYAPYTWVGGLFECDVSKTAKEGYLKSLQDPREFTKPYEFTCDPSNSRPLLPLIADDVTSQWIEKEQGWTISQRIPYLYTPGILDLRYGKPAKALGLKSDTVFFDDHSIKQKSEDALPYDKWTLELEVNENYNYTEGDINKLTEAITYSTNTLNHFLKLDHKKLLPWEWDKVELMGPDKAGLVYLEGKLLGIIGKMKDKSLGSAVIKTIQGHWDNLTLSIEQFEYSNK